MINDLDCLFWGHILEKGRKIDKNFISNISIGDIEISADVQGHELYHVSINRDFSDMRCTCPCSGFYCKHLAAFIIALSDRPDAEAIFSNYKGSKLEQLADQNRAVALQRCAAKEKALEEKRKAEAEKEAKREEKRRIAEQKHLEWIAKAPEREAKRKERERLEEERKKKREEREKAAEAKRLAEKQKREQEEKERAERFAKWKVEAEQRRIEAEKEAIKQENIRLSYESYNKEQEEIKRQEAIDKQTKKGLKKLPKEVRDWLEKENEFSEALEASLTEEERWVIVEDGDDFVFDLTYVDERTIKVGNRTLRVSCFVDPMTSEEYCVADCFDRVEVYKRG